MKWRLPLALGCAVLIAGCTGEVRREHDADRSVLGLAWHDCPDAVEIALVTQHRCGTMTVPVEWDDPDGVAIPLSVVQVWPSVVTSPSEVVLSVGFNFGEPMQAPGDMHALAERLGVPVIALAPRGVGEGGGIGLECPEVGGTGGPALSQSDAAVTAAFTEGVARCHERLRSEGVPLEAFGVDDLVADVDALRSALEIDRWYAAISYGELSRVVDAYASMSGNRIRAAVVDSPAPSGADSFALAGNGFSSSLRSLFAECADDPICARRYPRLETRWHEALERMGRRPLSASVAGDSVEVGAARFVRAVRAILGGGFDVVPDLPRIITSAADGRLHPTLTSVLASEPDVCLGHRPICTKPGFALGAYLSQACPELGGRWTGVDADPLYRDVFEASPDAAACEIWGVERVEPAPPPGVPTLVLVGDLDAWSRPEWFDRAIAVRGATHDVAGSSRCVFELRNPWIADPTMKPDPSVCSEEPFPDWD